MNGIFINLEKSPFRALNPLFPGWYMPIKGVIGKYQEMVKEVKLPERAGIRGMVRGNLKVEFEAISFVLGRGRWGLMASIFITIMYTEKGPLKSSRGQIFKRLHSCDKAMT